jgi:hypothetical protein
MYLHLGEEGTDHCPMIDIADDTHISNNAIGTNPTISYPSKRKPVHEGKREEETGSSYFDS